MKCRVEGVGIGGDLGMKCRVGGVGFEGDPGVKHKVGGIGVVDKGDGDLEALLAVGVDGADIRDEAGDEFAVVTVNDVVNVDELDGREIVDLGHEQAGEEEREQAGEEGRGGHEQASEEVCGNREQVGKEGR